LTVGHGSSTCSRASHPHETASFRFPLSEIGLGCRFVLGDIRQVVLVVGGDVTDFFLFHGLSRIRPYVYWLPSDLRDNEMYLYALSSEVRRTAQSAIGGGNRIEVTTLSDPDGVEAAVERLGAITTGSR